jgi:hypothetical protein
MQHAIRLSPASPGRYSAEFNGSAIVTDSKSAITDAARVILASGASPEDELCVAGTDFSFIPMPIGTLAAPRPKPPSLGNRR